MGAEFFHADGQTDDHEISTRFCVILRIRLRTPLFLSTTSNDKSVSWKRRLSSVNYELKLLYVKHISHYLSRVNLTCT
jgi:hypothetical protein